MDLAVRSTKVSERKAWETISLLIAIVSKTGRFPVEADLKTVRSQVNSLHREKENRTSDLIFTLKMFELGERELREFLSAKAWDGLPGFGEPIPEGNLFLREDRLAKAASRGKKKRSSFDLEKFLEKWYEWRKKK
jgi:hypothetical protein